VGLKRIVHANKIQFGVCLRFISALKYHVGITVLNTHETAQRVLVAHLEEFRAARIGKNKKFTVITSRLDLLLY